MQRKEFLQKATGVAGLAAFGTRCSLGRRAFFRGDFDVLIRGGTVYDGTGAEPFVSDVGISGGIIAAVGNLAGKTGTEEFEAHGLAVAPGFIDLHSHSDLTLFWNPRAESKIRQGVTTEVVGQDGRSVAPVLWVRGKEWRQHLRSSGVPDEDVWWDFPGYFRALRRKEVAVNVVSMIGASALRQYVALDDARPLNEWELRESVQTLRVAMRGGGRFVSSGLEYLPGAYATKRELIAYAEVAGTYVTHLRNEDDRVLEALDEAVDIALRSGANLHISHIKAQGTRNWDKLDAMLQRLDSARGLRRRVTCDRYPYTAYNNGLANLFPLAARQGDGTDFLSRLRNASERNAIRADVERKVTSLGGYDKVMLSNVSGSYAGFTGKRLSEAAVRLGRDPYDLLCDILIQSGGQASMVGFGMSEENLIKLLRYPHCAVASDGAALTATGGAAHPRNFGSFPKVLGEYVRDRGVLSMEEAIRKMTSLPAQILGVDEQRGRLAPNFAADVVVFNARTVNDRATYLQSRYPEGIEHVIVNGVPVLRNGDVTGERPGLII